MVRSSLVMVFTRPSVGGELLVQDPGME